MNPENGTKHENYWQIVPTEIDEREYVRKADVDEETKQSRLQGLKDQLELSDEPGAADLRKEVDELEDRIEEFTEFSPGTEVGSRS